MQPETPLVFDCQGDKLVGLLHQGLPGNKTGVLIVVGGPQYRVGSHRLFTTMARELAELGYPVFRFDYRGMGDSDGEQRMFDTIDDDIESAVAAFRHHEPGLDRIVLFGLCDGASAAVMYAGKDSSIDALALLNPWVRSTASASRARLWYYYPQRLFSKALWTKIVRAEFDFGKAARGLISTIKVTLGAAPPPKSAEKTYAASDDFVGRMRSALADFRGRVSIALCDIDLTAQEFKNVSASDARWRKACGRKNVETMTLRGADHTLSKEQDRQEYVQKLHGWLSSLPEKQS